MFHEITPRYDLMNRLMSARRDVAWRNFTLQRLPAGSRRILDVATGTGDVALTAVARFGVNRAVGLDFVPRMVQAAAVKSSRRDLSEKTPFLVGDALDLPFADAGFDATTIAFGLRNIPDRRRALAEMRRVTRPGGKVLILELTFPRNLKLRAFYQWHLSRLMPLLGRLIARRPGAYEYLPRSILEFLHPDELSALLVDVGLTNVRAFPLALGIAYLHEGVVKA